MAADQIGHGLGRALHLAVQAIEEGDLSPEQVTMQPLDGRSDMFSLGIVLYELTAGRPPFTGENPVAIAYKQVHNKPQPLNELVPDIPQEFEAIVATLTPEEQRGFELFMTEYEQIGRASCRERV